MHASNFLFWLDPLFWLMLLLALMFALLAGLDSLIAWTQRPAVRQRLNRLWWCLCLLMLGLSLLLALSGCGTQPSPGKPVVPSIPAELMQPPGKPILLVPSLPGSTSTLPSPTKPRMQPPAEKTERRISA